MTDDQNLTHIRGDDLSIPVTVTLDQSRSLDGNETWKWVLKANAESHALVTKTSPTGITLDGSTHQPTIVLTPADFSSSQFPDSINDQVMLHELEMTKSCKVETILRGTFTLRTDIAT